jgi:hypothetical protein
MTVRELCYAAEDRVSLARETLVVECMQWGILCDELGRLPTPAEYAERYQTTPQEAERRLTEFTTALELSPLDLNQVQWDGAPRNNLGNLFDDVRIVYSK